MEASYFLRFNSGNHWAPEPG